MAFTACQILLLVILLLPCQASPAFVELMLLVRPPTDPSAIYCLKDAFVQSLMHYRTATSLDPRASEKKQSGPLRSTFLFRR